MYEDSKSFVATFQSCYNLPPNPSGPNGMGSGAIDKDTSRSRSLLFSESGGLLRANFSSSMISSIGG